MKRFQNLQLNKEKKEKINFQDQMLHYGLYVPRQEAYFFGDIPWHWHDEFEFGYLYAGKMIYRTNHDECTLEEGDGVFINSGVLHYLQPLGNWEEVRLQSQFIDKSFLCGLRGNIIDMKYITPVQEQKQIEMIPLYKKNPKQKDFLDKMQQAAALGRKREEFFELRLRRIFSELWEEIYSQAMESKPEKSGYSSLDDERIKQLILFIQEHFSEKLTVKDIADSVPISERECYRLFQNILKITPVQYVISLRLQKAQELLRDTNKSILEIAIDTGFEESSYFGKIFKEYHHVTPKEYRKML